MHGADLNSVNLSIAGLPKPRLLACRECDALLTIRSDEQATFRCPRCNCVVHRAIFGHLDNALAFYLAACVLFVIANSLPIASIEAAGNRMDTTLLGAAGALRAQQMNLVALLVIATTVVIPAIELFCVTSLLLLAKFRHSGRLLAGIFRLREKLRPWSMVEIFVLGTMVAMVKLSGLASVVIGAGAWSLAAFMLVSAAAAHAFDPLGFWNEIEASE